MPELPEVETVKRGLDKLIIGKTIATVSHDWPKGFPNDPAIINTFVCGSQIIAVRRRAKVLMIDLNSAYSLIVHLKMTGQLVFVAGATEEALSTKHEIRNKSETENDKHNEKSLEFRVSNFKFAKSDNVRFGAGHPNNSLIGILPDTSTRVQIVFDDGSTLFFNDQRKFGWVKAIPTETISELPFFQKVGPEPLAASTTAGEFITRIRRRKKSMIKPVLLDQAVIAGVGNIYADESLWMAKIHPETRVGDVSDEALELLFKELQKVLKIAIEAGGSTDRNYVNAEGKKGSYTSFAKVFRREGKACERCGTSIEKTKVSGRGTHTCPFCQVLGKKGNL